MLAVRDEGSKSTCAGTVLHHDIVIALGSFEAPETGEVDLISRLIKLDGKNLNPLTDVQSGILRYD